MLAVGVCILTNKSAPCYEKIVTHWRAKGQSAPGAWRTNQRERKGRRGATRKFSSIFSIFLTHSHKIKDEGKNNKGGCPISRTAPSIVYKKFINWMYANVPHKALFHLLIEAVFSPASGGTCRSAPGSSAPPSCRGTGPEGGGSIPASFCFARPTAPSG